MSKWVEQFNGRMDGWGRKLHEKEIRIPVDLVTGILLFALALIMLLVMPSWAPCSAAWAFCSISGAGKNPTMSLP